MPFAYTVKFGVGLFFLLIYTVHYGDGMLSADAGEFMRESKLLNDVFHQSPTDYFKFLIGLNNDQDVIDQYLSQTTHWNVGGLSILNDNRNVLRVHSIIHFISFNNAVIHVLVMSFISMIATKQLFHGIRRLTTISHTSLFWILFFIPSVLFWTSGILKEPMMILGFSLFVRAIFDSLLLRKRMILLVLGLILLSGFKPYVLISLIPAVLFFAFYKILPRFRIIGATLMLGIITAGSLIFLPEKRDAAVHVISRKQFDFNNVAHGGLHAYADTCFYFFEPEQYQYLSIEGDSVSVKEKVTAAILKHGEIDEPKPVVLDSTGQKWFIYYMNRQCFGYIDMTLIDNSFSQLMKNIPEALQNSLIRPFITDRGSWLKYPAVLEVWMVFLFLIYAIIKRKKLDNEKWAIIISIALFVLCLSLIIGWITPVLGAITRYRIPAIIGLVTIALILIRTEKNTAS